jgi:hypothetical protein
MDSRIAHVDSGRGAGRPLVGHGLGSPRIHRADAQPPRVEMACDALLRRELERVPALQSLVRRIWVNGTHVRRPWTHDDEVGARQRPADTSGASSYVSSGAVGVKMGDIEPGLARCSSPLPFMEQDELVFEVDDLEAQDGQIHEIFLGDAAGFALWLDGTKVGLYGHVPVGWRMVASNGDKTDVFAALGGDWASNRTMSLAEASARIWSGGSSPSGLFFDHSDGGYVRGALKLAIVTLHAWAHLAEMPDPADGDESTGCQFSLLGVRPLCFGDGERLTAERIQRYIDDHLLIEVLNDREDSDICDKATSTIRVGSGIGKVWPSRVFADASRTAAAFHDDDGGVERIFFCDAIRLECGLADYYFWWAARLWHYYERCESIDAGIMALFTLKCGIAEIATIASYLLHEILHYDHFWGEGHCRRWPCRHGCCTYLIEDVFNHRLSARLGVPLSHARHGGDPTADDRFDEAEPLPITYNDAVDGCEDMRVTVTHEEPMYAVRRPIRVDWSIPDRCHLRGHGTSGTMRFG